MFKRKYLKYDLKKKKKKEEIMDRDTLGISLRFVYIIVGILKNSMRYY